MGNNKIFGDIKKLAPIEKKALERLSRRRIPPTKILTPEIARALTDISVTLKRQIGILVDRQGQIHYVIVGDHQRIFIPDLSYLRRAEGRLKGIRCIHVHLKNNEPINLEDLMDMALLRLDAMIVIEVNKGYPGKVYVAHLLPPNPSEEKWHISTYEHPNKIDINFDEFIIELESEIHRLLTARPASDIEEKAILIHVSNLPKQEAERSLRELEELARSAQVQVLKSIRQRVKKYNPAYLLGTGKLKEILMESLYLGATMIIFDQELTPVQVNNIAKLVDLKVIDRTQLILDIFARRAQSKEGKIQVELAQLKYLLPRLVGRGVAMSRLTGGIGGRGPGEQKLEIHRRRVKQKIASLERELKNLTKGRRQRRKRRVRNKIPVVSIIGYTNAGKSTLLNRLTGSNVLVENKLFATLDPINRRLILPSGREILLADTVGFIKNMPKDLKVAFKATLEELEDADIFLHVVDITSPQRTEEIETVEDILEEMNLHRVPRILVWNKIDILPPKKYNLPYTKEGICCSALTGEGLDQLKTAIDKLLPNHGGFSSEALSQSALHTYI